MRAREGDLILTGANVVFDVKGTTHPADKIVAFPRFIPQAAGERQGKNANYGKVYSLGDRYKYLQENSPDLIVYDPVFGETLCEVPINQIAEVYQPTEKLAQLRQAKKLSLMEQKALQLAVTLKKKAGIPWSAIGVSGSIMVGLTTSTSDIDPLVYGVDNSRKCYRALQELRESDSSGFKAYSSTELKTLYDFRVKDTQMNFQDFIEVESRKAYQGMFLGTEYFIRFVKDWNEINQQYGDLIYKNSGYCKIHAKIADATDALFTPCVYKLGNVVVSSGSHSFPIQEIVSFRGRFCMQAEAGERVEAQGKVELVTNNKTGEKHYRLILGNKPEDYMVLLR